MNRIVYVHELMLHRVVYNHLLIFNDEEYDRKREDGCVEMAP